MAATSLLRGARCRLLAALSVFMLNGAMSAVHAEDIVVIMNKDNPNAVGAEFVTRLYTGAIKGWPDGHAAVAYDQPEDAEAREIFCTSILRRSSANLRAVWSQNIFTGKGLPPKIAGQDAAVKAAVAGNRYAIGYIRASQVDDTVKVVR